MDNKQNWEVHHSFLDISHWKKYGSNKLPGQKKYLGSKILLMQNSGVNILHYSQIKYLGKVSLFGYFSLWQNFFNCGTRLNILRYSQIKYLGKVSIFWYFGEEFPHFYQCFKTLFQILMKNANNFVESMIYALLLGKSFSLTFGKCFLGFRKIFTPAFKYYISFKHFPLFFLRGGPIFCRTCCIIFPRFLRLVVFFFASFFLRKRLKKQTHGE